MNESDVATFDCTAIGTGDLNITWDVDGGSINSNTSSNGYVTSTLKITGATINLTVTCIVTQTLTSSIITEEPGVEVRLPRVRMLHRVAQLTVIPAITTTGITAMQPVSTQSLDPPSSGSESDSSRTGNSLS